MTGTAACSSPSPAQRRKLAALFLAHRADLFTLNPQGGGWTIELQALMLFSAITVMLIGPGKAGINEK